MWRHLIGPPVAEAALAAAVAAVQPAAEAAALSAAQAVAPPVVMAAAARPAVVAAVQPAAVAAQLAEAAVVPAVSAPAAEAPPCWWLWQECILRLRAWPRLSVAHSNPAAVAAAGVQTAPVQRCSPALCRLIGTLSVRCQLRALFQSMLPQAAAAPATLMKVHSLLPPGQSHRPQPGLG